MLAAAEMIGVRGWSIRATRRLGTSWCSAGYAIGAWNYVDASKIGYADIGTTAYRPGR